METLLHNADVCIVGGGIAGICAALAAARNGAQTILVHDRPVLGGNASSEIRMWICGAHGTDNRETGIIEEILLDNIYKNPEANYSLWDAVLYGKLRTQKNLTLLLNTICLDATMGGEYIESIKCWELHAETWHHIQAKIFCDCSGDSILAPLSGAEFRYGREASSEFGEDIAPTEADTKTMGHSCLIQARETAHPVEFRAPDWARKYESFDEFPHRGSLLPDANAQNYWWIEIGGMGDALHETAKNRDTLVAVCLGIWHLIKNHPETCDKYRNWALDWMGWLPGKRESRRFVGDYILTQNDVRSGGKFPDIIAYGGWSMDDHHPEGLDYPGHPTIFHHAPSPYGIPYRCLYSKNIKNLLFAGRNISVTHSALSSCRVMATCGTLGHAAGLAAALAIRHSTTPRKIYQNHLHELQRGLQREDAWLPRLRYPVSAAVSAARLSASNSSDPAPLRTGRNRSTPNEPDWQANPGDSATYQWDTPLDIKNVRLVFDSDLNRGTRSMPAMRKLDDPSRTMPRTLVKSFTIETCDPSGTWHPLTQVAKNFDRLVSISVAHAAPCTGLRFTLQESWGTAPVKIFAFDFE